MNQTKTNQNKAATALFVIISAMIVLCMSACDPGKRIARILKRHPELIRSDTVWKKDTITTLAVSHDSSFHFYQPDTVYVREGKLTVKYVLNKDSTVYLQGECAADTVIKYYPVAISNVSVKAALSWGDRVRLWLWENWWWIFGVLWVLWKVFGKLMKSYITWL